MKNTNVMLSREKCTCANIFTVLSDAAVVLRNTVREQSRKPIIGIRDTSRFDLDASRYKSLLSTFSSFAVRGKKGNVACGSRFTGVQQRVETRAQVAAYTFGGINQV